MLVCLDRAKILCRGIAETCGCIADIAPRILAQGMAQIARGIEPGGQIAPCYCLERGIAAPRCHGLVLLASASLGRRRGQTGASQWAE